MIDYEAENVADHARGLWPHMTNEEYDLLRRDLENLKGVSIAAARGVLDNAKRYSTLVSWKYAPIHQALRNIQPDHDAGTRARSYPDDGLTPYERNELGQDLAEQQAELRNLDPRTFARVAVGIFAWATSDGIKPTDPTSPAAVWIKSTESRLLCVGLWPPVKGKDGRYPWDVEGIAQTAQAASEVRVAVADLFLHLRATEGVDWNTFQARAEEVNPRHRTPGTWRKPRD